jgi:hypothetical protein
MEKTKYKRRNYLIDKPFQLGFIFRFMLIVLVTIGISISITSIYFWFTSNFGTFKLDTVLSYTQQGQAIKNNKLLFIYEKDKIDVIKEDENTYRCYFKYTGSESKFEVGDIVSNIDLAFLKPKITPVTKITTRFKIIFLPLVFTGIGLILIQSIFSLFFSHRIAGPIYRIRVSLDRMLEYNDYDFIIKVRKHDFFDNIATRLDRLRQRIFDEKKNKK